MGGSALYMFSRRLRILQLGSPPSSSRRTAMSVARTIAALLLLSLGLSACGSSSSTRQSGLTADQIIVTELSAPVTGLSAYEVVQQYRSNWLRKRGPTSINNQVPIKVYLDGTGSPYGSLEALRRIRAANVASIQHFDASEAHYRFGLGNVAGAILVRTRTGREGS